MSQFLKLLPCDYHCAVEQTRSGFAPNYPSEHLVSAGDHLDHKLNRNVLNRNAVASSIMTVELTRSNHRSLLANIGRPRFDDERLTKPGRKAEGPRIFHSVGKRRCIDLAFSCWHNLREVWKSRRKSAGFIC